MLMAGICGAQLQEIRGEKDNTKYLPHLMGHEGVGIVESIGKNVRTVKVGDKVVCHWKKGSGTEAEAATYMIDYEKEDVTKGTYVCGGPCHTWADQVSLSENRVTSVPQDTPDELCVLLGCALSTGLGVCENDACLRMGESVLIVGCGGVGLCCIAAARAMGCEVWAHDKNRVALSIAQSLGAKSGTLFENSVDHSIDTTGNHNCINFAALAAKGRCVLVGQPAPQDALRLENARHLFASEGKRIIASQGGQFNPAKDIPRYIQAWRQGHLKIDNIITHRFPLAQVNEAIDTLKSGVAGRVVLTMP